MYVFFQCYGNCITYAIKVAFYYSSTEMSAGTQFKTGVGIAISAQMF